MTFRLCGLALLLSACSSVATSPTDLGVDRNDRLLSRTLQAGTYRFVVDSFTSNGVSHQGAYILVILACEPQDPDC